jgi:carboxyl-terminal processing protease
MRKLLLVISGGVMMLTGGYFVFNEKKEPSNNTEETTLQVLNEAEKLIKKETIYSISQEKIIEGALKGMTEAINDPYSVYYTKEEAALHKQSLASDRVGIGIELTESGGKFLIIAAIKKSPAHEAGIAPFDEIVQIGEQRVAGKSMQDVLKMLQGKEGGKVEMTIYRPSAERHFTFTLERKKLTNDTVDTAIVKEGDKTIGIVEIHLFGEPTYGDWLTAVKSFEEQKVSAMIIDLRNNPGGYLHATTQMLSTFHNDVMRYGYMENSRGELEPLQTIVTESKDNLAKFLQNIPIVLLMNGGSASASEVFAAALKKWEAATIIGEKSFGKGTVQETWPLSNGGEMKLSTHKWLTLDREWIHHKGITPHIEQSAHPLQQLQLKIITKDYTIGDFSEDISYVQQVLDALGYTATRTDGYFDEGTANAIVQFRKNHKIIEGNDIDAQFIQTFMKVVQDEKNKRENDPQVQMGISYILHELEQK